MATEIPQRLEPWSHLTGKTVMVTGASSGLGLEFCLDLAKAGCRVVAAARRTDRLKSLCDQINAMDGGPCRAIAVQLDVTSDGPAIAASVDRAWAAFGSIDALINNAGIRGKVRSSIDLAEEEWNSVVKTNLSGSWLVSKYVGERMCRGGSTTGGSIINISSISGLNRPTFRGGVAYGASKAGLDSLTKSMAIELGDYNIRVNSIAPGVFKSEITEDLLRKNWLKNVAEKSVPLKTFGTSDPALRALPMEAAKSRRKIADYRRKIADPLGRFRRFFGDNPPVSSPFGVFSPDYRRIIADHCGHCSAIIRR